MSDTYPVTPDLQARLAAKLNAAGLAADEHALLLALLGLAGAEMNGPGPGRGSSIDIEMQAGQNAVVIDDGIVVPTIAQQLDRAFTPGPVDNDGSHFTFKITPS